MGATVAAPPRAFFRPCLCVASAPVFASCNNPKQKCVAARSVSKAHQFPLASGFPRTFGGSGSSRTPTTFGATVADPRPRAFVSPFPSIASAPPFAYCDNPKTGMWLLPIVALKKNTTVCTDPGIVSYLYLWSRWPQHSPSNLRARHWK